MPIRPRLLAGAAAFPLLVLASLGSSRQLSPGSAALLIRDVTILSMDDETPRRGSVLVRGDRIEYAGRPPVFRPRQARTLSTGAGAS
jgi:hypothetical protein